VLGPTLFTLFTNDLPSCIKSGDAFMYADDTTVFCIGSSQDVACTLLNYALEELFTWCVNNRLTPHLQVRDNVTLQSSAYWFAACHLHWQVLY